MTLYGTKPQGYKSPYKRFADRLVALLDKIGVAGAAVLILLALIVGYCAFTLSLLVGMSNQNTDLYNENAALKMQIDRAAHGDLNRDGKVDNSDLNLLYTNWSADTPLLVGDLNHDGKIDDKDATILYNHWSDRSQVPVQPTRSV